ncbi:hypothetical protein BX600DRAFT_441631 [Xylariales sp. PMI_506]|nr:hypothetical protein BX600DRAFT_441631 [Xylariales sp. PMI_506]
MMEAHISLYDIRQLPGRGTGIVASVGIPKGTRILCEKPLLIVKSMAPAALNQIIAKQLRGLPKDEQRKFLGLHNNFPGSFPLVGIVKTNALPCGSGSSTGGIYPTICRINHSCRPNAHNNWNEDEGHETIYSISDIAADEEITISYDKRGPYSERQEELQKNFGFKCDCSVCLLPPEARTVSDDRRMKIKRLDTAIGDPHAMMSTPSHSLGQCRELLGLLQTEYGESAGASVPRLYYDAFQISIAHGDKARARIFAQRAYEARIICEGEDSPTIRLVKAYMESPDSHSTFGAYTMKWKNSEKFMPEDKASPEFQKWLWSPARKR